MSGKMSVSNGSYPVIANSFPKSGTHLLVQILQKLPGIRDWGMFLASMPSVPYREIDLDTLRKRIIRSAENELIPSHLFYSPIIENALHSVRAIHYFIYRDIRDVVISDAYYLRYMNRWHRLSRFFRSCHSDEEAIMLSIRGISEKNFKYDFPNITERFKRYQPWINNNDVYAIKYENLIGEARDIELKNIINFYNTQKSMSLDVNEMLDKMKKNIQPEKSHTFRKGESGSWKKVMTNEHIDLIKEISGQLLIDLGYENTINW